MRGLTFGDVWLCSGQSNMEWSVKQAHNPEAELAESANLMARDLNKRLGVPIGLIQSSWGGSNIEGWISGTARSTLNGQSSDVA